MDSLTADLTDVMTLDPRLGGLGVTISRTVSPSVYTGADRCLQQYPDKGLVYISIRKYTPFPSSL